MNIGEKVNVVRHPDNLQPEGQFVSREPEQWAPGERASVVKRSDNLQMEGQIDTSRKEWATKKSTTPRSRWSIYTIITTTRNVNFTTGKNTLLIMTFI